MARYVLTRLLMTIPTLLVLSVIIFVLIRSVPGDPAVLIVGDVNDVGALAAARERLGLNETYAIQYFRWIGTLFSGDLGTSVMTGEPVMDGILARFPVTAQVVVAAMVIALLIAVPLGIFAAWRQNSTTDLSIMIGLNFLLSIPSFWMGLMLILVFGVHLDWLPTLGYVSLASDFERGLLYLVMPVASIALIEAATLTRMMRASTIEVLRQEYVTHARAKGLPESLVLRRHVFKNSFGPTMTFAGLMLGALLGGVAVIETVFTLPGIGRYLVEAIYSRDYAVVQGVLLFVALVYILVNLAVDLLYPLFEPRVRL